MAVPQLFVQAPVQTLKTKLEHDFSVLKHAFLELSR